MKTTAMTSSSLLVALFCVAAVSKTTNGQYVNPCNEFDTAATLNTLYYRPNDGTSNTPSYLKSGMFIHGFDSGGGADLLSDPNASPETPGKYQTLPAQNFSIGSDTLIAPVCPVEITNGEYPWYCPTPMSIAAGAVSFSYVRNDVAPPVYILNEYNKTGVDPYSGQNNTAPNSGAWPGPGYILSPSYINPEMEVSNNMAISESSFWDNNRVGYSWTTDGSSFERINCGNGISLTELKLGYESGFEDAGPAVDPNTVVMQCPPSIKQWEEYASRPEGWERYCPEESFSDYETYNSYNYNKISTYLSNLPISLEECWSEFIPKCILAGDSLDALCNNANATEMSFQCLRYLTPRDLMCGIPPSKFDNIYVPAQKFVNWPKERKELVNITTPGFSAGYRETVFKSWHGVGFNEFGRNMVFYANYGDDKSVDEALEHAKDFYQKSQLNGGTPIRIPVVIMNTDNMWLREDGVQPPPFTCPTSSNATTSNVSTISTTRTTATSSARFISVTVTSLAAAVVSLMAIVG